VIYIEIIKNLVNCIYYIFNKKDKESMIKPSHYSEIKTGRSNSNDWLNKYYPEFYKYVQTQYEGIELKTALYMFYNDIDSVPLCKTCKKPVKFHGYTYEILWFCRNL
jgi:hypothetical protein